MENEIENKTIDHKPKAHFDSNWIFILFALVFIVVIAFLFQQTQLKEKEDFSLKQLNPSPPGIKIERYDSKISSNQVQDDIVSEINKFSNSLSDQGLHYCAIGLEKTVKLYNSGFYEDAFFKFGIVSENVLFAYYKNSEGETKIADSIKKAFERKLISRDEKNHLFKAKSLRNLLAHNPDTEIEKEKIDRYLKNSIFILKKIAPACEAKLLVA